MREPRPNIRCEVKDLWSLERMAAGVEPGEFVLRPRFGKAEVVQRSWSGYWLVGASVLGLGYVLFV